MVGCSAPYCNKGSGPGGMFRFPKEPERLLPWKRNIGKPVNCIPGESRLCEVLYKTKTIYELNKVISFVETF